MAEKTVTFVTGNLNKLREAQSIVSRFSAPVALVHRGIDLDEIQGSVDEIAEAKCRQAAAIIGGPTLIEDTSLGFRAMGGLPGPYVKWFMKALGAPQLPRMLADFDDKHATAMCVMAYTEGPGAPIHVFKGTCDGRIVTASGPTTFGWDCVFAPEGQDGKTFAEMTPEAKNQISHRSKAFKMLAAFFANA
ncbi:hypothetical protein CXG81DRAFT_24936 [Caulochytrium protostelioides]|uniref:Inosine triphosphate pyrophosphatase n=1 Tax=Caulochytrium protostelioides TaxID=1555241 RepID=A0A4P9XAM8_9FUNG|nr:inosine triphosphate pyrophosphatase [Caulochytrium protostelioides]RKP02392.1 hypothetical protein CXG81DRAFT_24936 [Caulochytrium protostelioides]|eukprot:RKP02392.1 hypothetical protein CXG81DRAFT_24936 [Caulochytrium protostelioides]